MSKKQSKTNKMEEKRSMEKEHSMEKGHSKEEQVISRYDRKQQKRKEQEAKEKRQKKINTVIGIVIAAAIVCFIASFPIRTLVAVNQTYITVNDEKITKVEFDYHYNTVINNYYSQYGSYMSYFGVDLTGDLSAQMYSETLTWQDYFEEMAVESIKQSKALMAGAKAASFHYDAAKDYEEFKSAMKGYATEEGYTLDKYLKLRYGTYASSSRLKKYVEENGITSAYYNQLLEEKAPSDEEIQNYYEENRSSYDSVDYRLIEVEAELPTEPTELADIPEKSEDEESGEDADGTEGTEEEEYEPSEAEIEAAMAIAKEKAEEANAVTDGELYEGVSKISLNSNISDWLFDDSRTAGDTTVIEDSTNHKYFVVAFVNRYLDGTPSADVRVIVTDTQDGQVILDEWTSGAATEESFIDLYKKYDEGNTSVQDEEGLFSGLTKSEMEVTLAAWIFAEERQPGDTTAISLEEGSDFVIYYVAYGDPEWKLSIKSTLLSAIMTEYMEEIAAPITMEDPKGRLNYLKVQAQEEAAQEDDSSASTE